MELDLLDQAVRIGLAILVGSIIGLERMKSHKPAGMRTHALVTVICTMLTIVAAYGFGDFPGMLDPTRMIANIITGVGFLAGGVIFVNAKRDVREDKSVIGLTTAASIFGSAMLGIPIGLGFYPLVIITVLSMLISLKSEGALKKIKIIKDDDAQEPQCNNVNEALDEDEENIHC